jgi:phosphoketolase
MDEAVLHCTRGIGIWEWAGNEDGGLPDVVMACAGDVPTLEILAATALLHEHLPELKVRVVNVVDLMRLEPDTGHPHGLSDREFDALFTQDRPVVFAYHGYPWLIHRLTYRRTDHANIHVRGYKEEGTTTTPFDMVMLNDLDRFHLVIDVIDRVPGLGARAAGLRQRTDSAWRRQAAAIGSWRRSGRRRQVTISATRDGSSGAERLSTVPATAGEASIRFSRARNRSATWDSVSSPVRSTYAITETTRGPTISRRR